MALSKGESCRIGPSILNADLSSLASECQRMMDAGADYLHLDVMDGHFVPNMSFGHPIVKSLRPKLPGVFFDVHMMVSEPEKVGMSVNPPTDIEVLVPYIDQLDTVLVMTVNPGFGGQKFISDCMSKIQFLRSNYKNLDIGVDGGVSPKTIQECADAGANLIVSGSALVKHDNPRACIADMRSAIDSGLQKIQAER